FYARRARRILPSLTVVSIATLILGWIFLLPDGEQQNLAKSAIASALFVSNIFFWQVNSDYFADRAELQPLLHTWSLSVQDQYYLVWPALLLILWAVERHSRLRVNRLVVGVVLVLSIGSLALSIQWAAASPPSAFFLTPSRVWELGAGAALALTFGTNRRAGLPGSFKLIGLSLIVAAATLYNPRTPFPGLAAILPVAGTALVIASTQQGGLIHVLLASRPMVTTGKISYAWYLWHWPLLAIARVNDIGGRNLARDTLLAVFAYVLAYFSTWYLETPIRQKRFRPFSSSFGSLVGGLSLILISVSLPIALWAIARSEYGTTSAMLAPESVRCQVAGWQQDESEASSTP